MTWFMDTVDALSPGAWAAVGMAALLWPLLRARFTRYNRRDHDRAQLHYWRRGR